MKFFPYVVKHLRRSWLRTLSTISGMALCIFLICVLQTVLNAMDRNIKATQPDRLATRHAVSLVFNMPYAYRSRISAVPGVKRVAPMIFFGCAYYPWVGLSAAPVIKYAVLINPLVYVSEGMRAALTPKLPHMSIAMVFGALAVVTTVFWLLGYRTFERRAVS